jgi:hypothetical protein
MDMSLDVCMKPTMLRQLLEIHHIWTDVTMLCLVHPRHTFDILDGTPGPHDSPQHLLYMGTGGLPYVDARFIQRQFRCGLCQLLLHPGAMVRRPLLTEQAPPLSPFQTVKRCMGNADVGLHPLPVAQLSFWTQ